MLNQILVVLLQARVTLDGNAGFKNDVNRAVISAAGAVVIALFEVGLSRLKALIGAVYNLLDFLAALLNFGGKINIVGGCAAPLCPNWGRDDGAETGG